MDITFDHKTTSIAVKLPAYCNGYKDILARSTKMYALQILQVIISNTAENYQIWLVKYGNWWLKDDIATNESGYMTMTVLRKEQLLTEVIYSSISDAVVQDQYIFDTLWI
jgi:two-component system, OmpR family, sensor histidine kinase VicK